MNPLSSRATQPRSQSVRGEAPAMMNTWRMSCVEVSPVFLSRHVTRSRCASPSSATISVLKCSSICGILLDPLDQIARHACSTIPPSAPACALCARSATGTRRLARRNFRRPRRSRLPRRTTAIPCTSRHNKFPGPRNFRDSAMPACCIARRWRSRSRARARLPLSSTT